MVLMNHQNDTRDLASRKAAAVLKPDGIEPDLGAISVALDVDVRRLDAITPEEKAAVGPDAKDGRHVEQQQTDARDRTQSPVAT